MHIRTVMGTLSDMAKNEWLSAGETVQRMAELGLLNDNGEVYDAQIVRRWHQRHPGKFKVRSQDPRRSLYYWPSFEKFLVDTGRLSRSAT